MEHSENIGSIAAAMAKAQKEMATATKAAKNPFFKSSYADFNSIREAVMPALNNNGIAVFQLPTETTGNVSVKTTLAHESGEWISCTVTVKPNKPDPQATGSAITYARRYGLSAITSCGCEDDDGNAATQQQQNNQQRQQQAPQGLTAAQKDWLAGFCKEKGFVDNETKKEFMAFYKFNMGTPAPAFEKIKAQIINDYKKA